MNRDQKMVKVRLSWFKHYQKKTKNIARTCRYFAISRHTYYFWLKRYQKEGFKGLTERSRRPLTSPKATSPRIIKKIVRLRKNFIIGPIKISQRLKDDPIFRISPKTVYLILKSRGLNRSAKVKKVLKSKSI